MQFNKIYITKQGKEIFANVNSGTSKLIWTNIYSSSTVITADDSTITPDNIASKDVFSNSNRTGSGKITAIQNGNTVQLSCRLENTAYSGIANCIGLYAHTEGQTDTLMIYAILDGADPVTIPSTDSEPFLALINVNMILSDVAVTSFEADTDWYASSKALQEETDARKAFDNRCVTTHVASSSTTGENQTIYGEKTFVQITKHSNDILPSESNKINLGSTNLKWKNVYATTFTGSVIGDLNGNATTATTATNLSDAPSLSWTNATNVNGGSTLTVTAGGKTSTATTITTVRQAYRPYVSTYSANISRPLVFTSSTTAGFKDLYTDTDNALYYNPSTNTLACPKINISSITSANVSHDLVVGPANVDGSTSLAIYPYSTNACWLGTSGKKFHRIYATSIYGDYFYGKFSVKGNTTNKSYPLIFADSVNTKTDEWSSQTLYTDTVNSLYYNPSTNTLTCNNLTCNTINVKNLVVDQASKLDFYKIILSDLGLYGYDVNQYDTYYLYQLDDQSSGGSTVDTIAANSSYSEHTAFTGSYLRYKYVLSRSSNLTSSQIRDQANNINAPSQFYTILFVQSYGKYYNSGGANGTPTAVLARRSR